MTINTLSDEYSERVDVSPCPFCGKDPIFRKMFTGDNKDCFLSISCTDNESHAANIEEKFPLGNIEDMPRNIVNATKRLVFRWNYRYK